MLLIMCVLFFLYNLCYLRKGRVFAETVDSLAIKFIDLKELEFNGEPIDDKATVEVAIKALLIFLFAIGMQIIELITFAYLLDHDAYTWPTVACIVITLSQFFMLKNKKSWSTKEDLIIAKAEALKRTPYTRYGVFSAIVHCVYYGYMILILTKLISL